MRKFFIMVSVIIFLTSCAVYKIDVQQGNVITQEMLDQLELNMSMQKVRFILGTPAIMDVFQQSRWDYIFSVQHRGGQREQRHIALFFEGERLVRIEGDVKEGTGKREQEKPPTKPDGGEQPPIL